MTTTIPRSTIVKKAATRAGFDLCGITTPILNKKYTEQYRKWLHRGYHASLKYMKYSAKRRCNPNELLPNVKSVIVLAINYFQQDSKPTDRLRISKYARGKDYHDIIEGYQKELLSILAHTFPDTQWKPTVDYGHVLERAYAEQAGIGFIGKNGNIITRKFGSYVFLSTIFTTLELEPDPPAGNRLGKCGTCARCIRACPTKAIQQPGLVDCNKCISYWTIENRSEHIPIFIQNNNQNYGYGCDICQIACPHNIRAQQTHHKNLQSTQGAGEFLSREIAAMPVAMFKKRYGNTALERAKQQGLQRNLRLLKSNKK